MSKPASRLTDMASGHQCFPPNSVVSASSNVIINGLGAARVGDSLNPHCCFGCHGTTITEGSPNVMVNGRPLTRVTSACSCPEVLVTGSSNVLTS